MPNDKARQVAIEAKHLRPRLDHVSLRPDVAILFAAAFDRRLTVLCAPAGYGKSTTTAAALDECGRTTSWYKLDVLDHDPLAFLAAMTRAVRRLHPGFGEALLRELESGPVTDLPAEVLAARFCSECDSLLDADLHLVLDDYHEAMDSAALNAVLGYLLENCPATLHFVVLTRYEPAFRLEKLRLGGDAARMPRDLLLFDAAQVEEILTQRSGRRHPPEHVQRLHELTEGWPASVVLAGMALEWLDVASLEETLADPRLRDDVFSYLAEQVFQRQSEDVQRFLLDTCCLEHVTEELGVALTGSPNASRHLHFLAHNHIFTFDTERVGAYRYHNLLRDFLRQRLVQEEGAAAFRRLQRETAVALEECGDQPGAVELLLSANELDLALGVIARGGEALLERRPYQQLRLWSHQVQPRKGSSQPWAHVMTGVLAARDGIYDEALADLRVAEAILDSGTDSAGLYDVLSIREWAEFWSGDSPASMATSERAFELAQTEGQKLHALLSILSAAVDMRQWEAAEAASEQAQHYLATAQTEEVARFHGLSAHAAYYRGDMQGALDLVRSNACGERSAQKAAALNIRGMVETALGNYTSAENHLKEATEIADQFGHTELSYVIADSRACLAGALGQLGGCLASLRALSSDTTGRLEPWLRAFVLCHQGTALRRHGAIEESLDPTALSTQLAPFERDPYLALNAAINLAYTEGLLGRNRQSTLLQLSERASQVGLRFVQYKARLFAAVLLHLEGDDRQAVNGLEQCLPHQLRLGHVNLIAQELCAHPELASALIRRHKRNGLGPDIVTTLAHSWRFDQARLVLLGNGPSQVRTWIGHVEAAACEQLGRKRDSSDRVHPTEGRPRVHGSTLTGLTARELEVLGLAAAGLSNDEVARALFISIPTVKTHMTHILRKLGQRSRLGAILMYQGHLPVPTTPNANRPSTQRRPQNPPQV
jgi:LuxR family maltose regulon positive regulatory protein